MQSQVRAAELTTPGWYWWTLGLGLAALLALLGLGNAPSGHWLADRTTGAHTVVEFFAIALASMVVAMAWHTFDQRSDSSANVLLVGLTVVVACDLLHVLTYEEMPALLTPADTQKSLFFWLMGRSFEVATIAAVGLGMRGPSSRKVSALLGVGVSGVLVLYGSFALQTFPATYDPSKGQTNFKVGFEALLCLANGGLAVALFRRARRSRLEPRPLLLSAAAALSALGGVVFATYRFPTDLQGLLAHAYKLVAYVLLYKASYLAVLLAPYEALKESEEQLRDSQTRLRTLADNLPNMVLYQMVILASGERRFTQVTDSIERVCGLSAAEVLRDSRLWYGQMLSGDVEGFTAAEQQAIDTKQPFDKTARFKVADGRIRMMRIVSAPRSAEDGRVIWDGFLADVTASVESEQAQKALEAQLREAQRLESIGTLASGIAHDFNNVLAVMLGNLSMVLGDARKAGNTDQALALSQAQVAGERARNLVRQILMFGRKQPVEMTVQPVASLVQDSVALLKVTIPAGVEFRVRIEDYGARAMVDRTQLEQVVVNLCTNAWHALEGRREGYVEVGLASRDLTGDTARAANLMPGRYVNLWVSDNGCGMDEATLARLYEPFFTTKPVGTGTGLGLPVVHGIVESHRGAIKVHSEPGVGTRFDIFLPALVRIDTDDGEEQQEAPAVGRHAAQAPAVTNGVEGAGNGEHVLYIDDVEIMALMVERLLTRANYNTSVAKSAEEGLALFKATPDKWDLLVTDFNMPLMSGLDVIREVRSLRPDLPTVLTSGYITDELIAQAQQAGVTLVLEKQHTFEELGKSLQGALQKAAAVARTKTPARD